MKDERLAVKEKSDFFSLARGMELAKTLPEAEEDAAAKSLTEVLYQLEKLVLSRVVNTIDRETTAQIRPFLRVISKRVQVESKKAGAWRYYLYGRYDGQQEYLFEQLLKKEKKLHTEEILSRKNVARVIKYLYANGYTQQAQIAKDLQIDVGNMVKLMDLLLEEELVEKTKGAKFVFYDLTQRGKTICNQYYRAAAYMEEPVEQQLQINREERNESYRLLAIELQKKDYEKHAQFLKMAEQYRNYWKKEEEEQCNSAENIRNELFSYYPKEHKNPDEGFLKSL